MKSTHRAKHAARLRALRKSVGLTQVELAKRIASSNTHIARVEAARCGSSMDLMERWAVACGATLSHVLAGEPAPRLAPSPAVVAPPPSPPAPTELDALRPRERQVVMVTAQLVPLLSARQLEIVSNFLAFMHSEASAEDSAPLDGYLQSTTRTQRGGVQ